MGFLDNNETGGNKSSDELDLVEYEKKLIEKFNDHEILTTRYKAEEFGITFKSDKTSDVYTYENAETIVICPEPLEFLKDFDGVSDNTHKANQEFLKRIGEDDKVFKRLKLDKTPLLKKDDFAGRMWMNKTLNGINLRPGNLNFDRDNFAPIRMCDDNVHGLIAGRTGSGKSVFINALILSLITEYAPWELNLYLADFKKVELSRYMNDADDRNGNTAFTPHVNACAATSEIRYVISLIKYLVDCMNARQEFFSRLGVTKIQEFRKKYNLVLPRVLLIVDEFQQLFMEATSREADVIQTMLNSITKLGRATGFHLIFASQEMSGTLRGNTLANFKIRMALPCNPQISADILGNGQAADLERNYVLVNTDSGDELKNKKYRVPYIKTDKKDDDLDEKKTPFYEYLDVMKLTANKFDLKYKKDAQKFYREELQEKEKDYLKELDDIKDKKNERVRQNGSLFDAIILGKTVLYSPLRNDKVSFYIEKGRNKGLMIASPDPDNAARIRKLLAENLFRSDSETYHFGMELNNLILERYKMSEAVKKYPRQRYFNLDVDKALEYIRIIYAMRQSASKKIVLTADEREAVYKAENRLIFLSEDDFKVAEHKRIEDRKRTLREEIKHLDDMISEASRLANKQLVNPVVKYLEKCSRDIVIVPRINQKADLVNVLLYKDVIRNFDSYPNVTEASQKSVELINNKLTELEKKNVKGSEGLAILQNLILRRSLLFYSDKYCDREPEHSDLSDSLEKCFSSVKSAISDHKNDSARKEEASHSIPSLTDKREELQNELDELLKHPDEIFAAEEELKGYIEGFVKGIFNDAFDYVNYKKDRPEIPEVRYKLMDGQLKWSLSGGTVEEEVRLCGEDILKTYANVYRGMEFTGGSFKKAVFWINGLDEMEKIPDQLEGLIRNAINQNILVVAIITSELRDILLRKTFDYAFITGNVESFYDMFGIKYTKQPLDSIVVNFGIRSKGFDIPFKMYKSDLEEVQAPNFIDQLLNEERPHSQDQLLNED